MATTVNSAIDDVALVTVAAVVIVLTAAIVIVLTVAVVTVFTAVVVRPAADTAFAATIRYKKKLMAFL
jgi:hypothetical protein